LSAIRSDPSVSPSPDKTEQPTLLDVENLAAVIGKRELLSDVSFAVRAGEAVGLVGETGSGKTLTCRAAMGLLPRLGGSIISGELAFAGKSLIHASEREWHALRGRRLALVPQSSLSGLNPTMTLGQQLRETIRYLTPEVDPRERASELLEQVHMPRPREVLGTYAHELSGGMRQRGMIALAIAGNPSLLIADEPTTALDVTVQRSILDLLADLRARLGMAVLIVTHDLAIIEMVTDRVAIMYAGITVEFGETTGVLSRPSHPYTQALLAARPGMRQAGERLAAIPGAPPLPESWPPGCRFAPRCPYAISECALARPAREQAAHGGDVSCIRHLEVAHG